MANKFTTVRIETKSLKKGMEIMNSKLSRAEEVAPVEINSTQFVKTLITGYIKNNEEE